MQSIKVLDEFVLLAQRIQRFRILPRYLNSAKPFEFSLRLNQGSSATDSTGPFIGSNP